MNTRIIRFFLGAAIALAIALLLVQLPMPTATRADAPLPFGGVDITVSTTADESDAFGNGTGCSLREAIHTSNTSSDYGGCIQIHNLTSRDTILLPSGTYVLTRTGSGEDLDITGDLDILRSITISATGATTPIVAGGASWDDRIFDIVSGTVTIKQVMITGGKVSDYGGGIFLRAGTTLVLNDSAMSTSFAGLEGGGIYNAGTLTLNNTTVSANIAGGNAFGFGGGIANAGVLTVSKSTIDGNHVKGSAFGGGIANAGGTGNIGVMAIADSTIRGNMSDLDCGGIDNYGISVQFNGNTLSGNTAVRDGGGICYPGEITNSLISENSAGEDGGGIYISTGITRLTNVTLSGNHANRFGGGMTVMATAMLINVTVFGNSAGGDGGIDIQSGTATLTNTLVANNPGGDCGGTIISLVPSNISSDNNCSFFDPGRFNMNVKLAPLGNYGGPTLTHIPLGGSPAINFGTNTGCPPTDQRGKPRPVNVTCDVGAVERQLIDYPFLYLPLILR